jgi:hypothetical protein
MAASASSLFNNARDKAYKNAEMNYCINQFDITCLDMAGQTQVDFDIHVKVYLTLHEVGKDTQFLVQELAAAPKTVAPYYNYFYISLDSPRQEHLVYVPWLQFQGRFDQLFKTVANEEADQNRKLVHDELRTFFTDQQTDMYNSILSSSAAQKAQISQLRTELLALTEIGLNYNHPAVLNWLRLANGPTTILSVEDVTGEAILRGKTIDDVRQAAATGIDTLNSALKALTERNDIMPDDSAISVRLNDLYKVIAVRAAQESGGRRAAR